MKPSNMFAALVLTAAALAPALAQAHHHRAVHRLHYGLPYPISFMHNYGPGVTPGTFAFSDGPASVRCRQSAANYIGADRRLHPCN